MTFTPVEWGYPEEEPHFPRALHLRAYIKGGGAPSTSQAIFRVESLQGEQPAYEQVRKTENAKSDPKRGLIAAMARSIESAFPLSTIDFVTNDIYVVGALRDGDLKKWKENGWRKSDGSLVHAADIWMRVDRVITERNLKVSAKHERDCEDHVRKAFALLRSQKPRPKAA